MKRTLAVLLALFLTTWVGAGPLTLDEAVSRALNVNTDYQSALLAVDRASNAVSIGLNWKNIAVSATRKESSASGAQASTSVGLNLPLFDQLGASATVDQDKNAQVSITANPLSHSDTAVQSQISYDKAVLAASQARTNLETSVRKAYWAQAAAEASLTVAQQKAALKETAYQDAKARYEKGSVTLAEVRTALQDWIQARTNQTAAERALIQSRTALASKLQTDVVEVPHFDNASLQALVDAMAPAPASGTTAAVQSQALEVRSQQARADAVWLLDPGLSVQAGATIPATGTTSWNGSVTLTLALGTWQGADKAVAQRSVDLAQQALEALKTATRASDAQAVLAVQSASDTVETRQLALKQAQELETETRLLAKAGEATALDLDDAILGVRSAEIDLFTAWADLYGARLDLAAVRS